MYNTTMPLTSTDASLLALGSSLCFSVASFGYSGIAKRTSPIWMNLTKTLIGFCCFILFAAFSKTNVAQVATHGGFYFALSGAFGMALADTFLFKAYLILGPAKAMILTRVQPVLLAVASFFLFGQRLESNQLLSFFCLVSMSVLLSIEASRKSDKSGWDFEGVLAVGVMILLDAAGILLSRYGMEKLVTEGVDFTSVEINITRFLGALITFGIISIRRPIHWYGGLLSLSPHQRVISGLNSVLGTGIAMYLWMGAVQSGNLGLIAAVSGSGPLFAFIVESFTKRAYPTAIQWLALTNFLGGMYFLTQ